MNRIANKSISLKYEDLVEFLQEHDINVFKGAAIHLATYTPHLEEMSRHDAGYVCRDGELVITVVADNT